MQPYYDALGFRKGDFPASEKYYREAITLPLYPGLSLQRQDHVIATLKNTLQSTNAFNKEEK
jgi:dTDP-4-amino-4,6-dideoxygalactose transaminase